MKAELKCDGMSYNLNIPDAMIVWDSCHKIYITRNPEEVAEATSYGYELYPVEELPRIWNDSCPLRFIELWDVDPVKRLIPQCTNGNVFYYDGELIIEVGEGEARPDVELLTELGYLTTKPDADGGEED